MASEPALQRNLDYAFPPMPGAPLRSVYERAGFDVYKGDGTSSRPSSRSSSRSGSSSRMSSRSKRAAPSPVLTLPGNKWNPAVSSPLASPAIGSPHGTFPSPQLPALSTHLNAGGLPSPREEQEEPTYNDSLNYSTDSADTSHSSIGNDASDYSNTSVDSNGETHHHMEPIKQQYPGEFATESSALPTTPVSPLSPLSGFKINAAQPLNITKSPDLSNSSTHARGVSSSTGSFSSPAPSPELASAPFAIPPRAPRTSTSTTSSSRKTSTSSKHSNLKSVSSMSSTSSGSIRESLFASAREQPSQDEEGLSASSSNVSLIDPPMVKQKICRGCDQRIVGKCVSSRDGRLSGKWHRQCFVCYRCGTGFDSEFYVLHDLPYCRPCYHVENNSICLGCGHGIEGECLETSAAPEARHSHLQQQLMADSSVDYEVKRYHPACLSCSECKTIISDGEYYILNGSTLCAMHAFTYRDADVSSTMEKRQTRLFMM